MENIFLYSHQLPLQPRSGLNSYGVRCRGWGIFYPELRFACTGLFRCESFGFLSHISYLTSPISHLLSHNSFHPQNPCFCTKTDFFHTFLM